MGVFSSKLVNKVILIKANKNTFLFKKKVKSQGVLNWFGE